MDKRMIEIADAIFEKRHICDEVVDCAKCPMYLESTGCICTDEGAYMEARKLVEAEEQADKEEALDYLDGVGEVESGEKTLEDYCCKIEDCDGCMYYTANCRCRVGYPATWENLAEGKQPEPVAGETPAPSFTPVEKRKRVLDDAIDAVCKDRCEMYGEVEDNFGVIAGLWNAYLKTLTGREVDLTPKEVAEMMILFKVGRAATAMEDHRDTYVDIAGYAACAGGMCDEKDV